MKKVKCPHCGQLTDFSQENPFRPFCSERCQLIDLGEWADEQHRIPGVSLSDSENDGNGEKNSTEESSEGFNPEWH